MAISTFETLPTLPSARVMTAARQQPLPFGLWLGQSTGLLTALGHGAGLVGGYPVVLGLQDAAQNIAIFGGIGSGKTTRAVQPLLVQLEWSKYSHSPFRQRLLSTLHAASV
jgi:hypothetical protein